MTLSASSSAKMAMSSVSVKRHILCLFPWILLIRSLPGHATLSALFWGPHHCHAHQAQSPSRTCRSRRAPHTLGVQVPRGQKATQRIATRGQLLSSHPLLSFLILFSNSLKSVKPRMLPQMPGPSYVLVMAHERLSTKLISSHPSPRLSLCTSSNVSLQSQTLNR